ncbi:hypothetical protein GGF46_003232 [Coemansia sp. RSA 552]|nr:hypothetical protein GGF46_003232 [Coemansia sp. RSA 552]
MLSRLQGKNVLITGASAGIGESCAYQFAAAGANLILTARRHTRLQSIKDKITTTYPQVQVHTAVLDVRDEKNVNAVINGIPGDLGNIDVLVNNAGLALGVDHLCDISNEAIDTVIDTNIKGLLYVSRAVVRKMKERGSGHIIMMGSIASMVGYPGGSIYCATKSAVHAISESLRAETMAVPIHVTEIKPGAVETEFSVVRFGGNEGRAADVYRGIDPLTADDVAETVVFTASRHPRCVVSEVVLLASGQASATLIHRKQ